MEKTLDKGMSGKTVNKRKSDDQNLPRLMRIRSNGLILKEVRPEEIDLSRINVKSGVLDVSCQNNNVLNSESNAKDKSQSVVSKENGKCDVSTQSCMDFKPLCTEHKEFFTSKKAKKCYSSDQCQTEPQQTGEQTNTNKPKGPTKVIVHKNVKHMAHKNIFDFVSVKCENEDLVPNNKTVKSTGPVQHATQGVNKPIYKRPVQRVIQGLNKPIHTGPVHSEQKSVTALSGDGGSCQILSIPIIMNNDRAMEFYTGLQNNSKFELVLESLGKDAYDLKYYDSSLSMSLTVPDQFLLTLALLRQHKSHYEMSILFNVSLKEIKNIFITWVRFMRLEWNKIQLPEQYKPIEKPQTTSGVIKKGSKKSNADKSEADKCKSPKEVTIDLADDKLSFKKVYKILNGPQNYIEAHLIDDIVYICHVLYFFKASKLRKKMTGPSVST